MLCYTIEVRVKVSLKNSLSMSKILSIIIPTYNMEEYLRKCLDSLVVTDGNMSQLEVLIINDGSKDSSSQIAHEYEAKYPMTFRVIDKENGNYGSCINRGLKEATGKYVKVLDADDYFDAKVFDSYVTFLGGCTADMIVTDYNLVKKNGKLYKIYRFSYPVNELLNVVDFCEDSNFLKLEMHAVTYTRSVLIRNHYVQTTGVPYTDQEWVFMPITFMDSFCYYNSSLYQYLVGREGQTIDNKIATKLYDVRCDLLLKRADYYLSVDRDNKLDKRKVNFLRNRLLEQSCSMYINALIFNECPISQIKIFDKELMKKNRQLYLELENSDLCKYKGIEFIGCWRKTGTLPCKVKLLKVLHVIAEVMIYSVYGSIQRFC